MTLKGLVAMIFGQPTPNLEHKPDPVRGSLTIAVEANQRAGAAARQALEDMLAASDRARGILIAASDAARGNKQ